MSEAKFDLSANQVVVEKSNIQPGTRQGYFNKLILLVQFCFDHTSYHDLIQTHLVNDLIVANDKDRNLPQKKAKQRKHLRKAITKMLKNMKRYDPTSSPIRLSRVNPTDRILAYEDLVAFMSTFKKEEKVNGKLAYQFQVVVEELSSTIDDEDLEEPITSNSVPDEDGEIIVSIRQEFSTYDTIRSAVTHLYTATAVEMPSLLKSSLALYIRGAKRLNKLSKQMLGLDLTEGKKGMSKEVYRKICEILFRSNKKEHLFAHLFFVLEW